jgi:serine/threonine protein kinase
VGIQPNELEYNNRRVLGKGWLETKLEISACKSSMPSGIAGFEAKSFSLLSNQDEGINMQLEQPTLTNGTILRGRYTIVGVLGKGGFSVVYKVKDIQNEGKIFALKVVTHPHKQERKLFTSESEILKQLDHPALPKVYDVFDDDEHNRACIIMNYVEGTNLEKLRRQQTDQRFSQTQVLTIMVPILDAVAYLHRHEPPVIHRDIKPANIIVRDAEKGSVLVDFGIAKEYDSDGTTSAIRYCTPGFSAPEQYTGGTEARSDIYGLAATLYLLLTSIVPGDALERLVRINEYGADPLAPINEIIPGIDATISESIHCALSLSKHDRFSDVEQFWQALQGEQVAQLPQALQSEQSSPIALMPAVPPKQRKSFQPQKRTIVALLVAAVLFCFIGTGLLFSARLFPGLYTATQKTAVLQKTTSSHSKNATRHTPSNGMSTQTATPNPTVIGPYAGTVHNIAADLTTAMTLTVQQQSQGNIRGSFMGLQVKGSFSGTIDTAQHIRFTVAGYASHAPLLFDGIMRSDGDLAGSFCSLDQNNQCTGYGIWSVIRSSSASTQSNINNIALKSFNQVSREKEIS